MTAIQARQPGTVSSRCYEQGMTSECRACRSGLEHCHGVLVHHVFQRSECTEDGCHTPDGEHSFHIDCNAVGCACDPIIAQSAGGLSARRVG